MRTRLAFLAGALCSYLANRQNPAVDIAWEAGLLRDEIRVARETVAELSSTQSFCEWEIWRQKWLLRLGGIFDILLIFWVVWYRLFRKPPVVPLLVADTGESSTESEIEVVVKPSPQKPVKDIYPGKGFPAKVGPSRPSDFRSGKK